MRSSATSTGLTAASATATTATATTAAATATAAAASMSASNALAGQSARAFSSYEGDTANASSERQQEPNQQQKQKEKEKDIMTLDSLWALIERQRNTIVSLQRQVETLRKQTAPVIQTQSTPPLTPKQPGVPPSTSAPSSTLSLSESTSSSTASIVTSAQKRVAPLPLPAPPPPQANRLTLLTHSMQNSLLSSTKQLNQHLPSSLKQDLPSHQQHPKLKLHINQERSQASSTTTLSSSKPPQQTLVEISVSSANMKPHATTSQLESTTFTSLPRKSSSSENPQPSATDQPLVPQLAAISSTSTRKASFTTSSPQNTTSSALPAMPPLPAPSLINHSLQNQVIPQRSAASMSPVALPETAQILKQLCIQDSIKFRVLTPTSASAPTTILVNVCAPDTCFSSLQKEWTLYRAQADINKFIHDCRPYTTAPPPSFILSPTSPTFSAASRRTTNFDDQSRESNEFAAFLTSACKNLLTAQNNDTMFASIIACFLTPNLGKLARQSTLGGESLPHATSATNMEKAAADAITSVASETLEPPLPTAIQIGTLRSAFGSKVDLLDKLPAAGNAVPGESGSRLGFSRGSLNASLSTIAEKSTISKFFRMAKNNLSSRKDPPQSPVSEEGNGLGQPSNSMSVSSSSSSSSSSTNIKSSGGVFGVALTDALRLSKISDLVPLPAVVYRCIEFLETNGAVKEEGIYRLSGSVATITALQRKFNVSGDYNILQKDPLVDANAVAGLLKLFLRQLPSPLVPQAIWTDLFGVIEEYTKKNAALRTTTAEQRNAMVDVDLLKKVQETLTKIAEEPRILLRTVVYHLSIVNLYEKENKMSACNLAIIFSPTIQIPTTVFIFLLEHVERIFNLGSYAQKELSSATSLTSLKTQAPPPSSSSSSNTSLNNSVISSSSASKILPPLPAPPKSNSHTSLDTPVQLSLPARQSFPERGYARTTSSGSLIQRSFSSDTSLLKGPEDASELEHSASYTSNQSSLSSVASIRSGSSQPAEPKNVRKPSLLPPPPLITMPDLGNFNVSELQSSLQAQTASQDLQSEASEARKSEQTDMEMKEYLQKLLAADEATLVSETAKMTPEQIEGVRRLLKERRNAKQ